MQKKLKKKYSADKPLNVLVQLQVDANDLHKSGIPYENAYELSKFILQSNKLNLQGFMGIGPNIDDKQTLKLLYREFIINCDNLWNMFSVKKNTPKIISLGMSQDLEIALECGSNMVRVGTAIFGERPKNN